MSLWDTIEKKYFKKTATVDDPHWFIKTHNDIKPGHIISVYNNMDIIGKGISGDSE